MKTKEDKLNYIPDMTLEEAQAEFEKWDEFVEKATSWGASLGAADEFRAAAKRRIDQLMRESEDARIAKTKEAVVNKNDIETYEITYMQKELPENGLRNESHVRVHCTNKDMFEIYDYLERSGFVVAKVERRDAMSYDGWMQNRARLMAVAMKGLV